MFARIAFLFIALFWVVMNVFLWRSEFGPRGHLGASLPAEVVWQRILTAPDNSALEIYHHGKKIGFCRWSATVGEEEAAGKMLRADYLPEGRIKQLSGYKVDLEGNINIGDELTRMRFDVTVQFATNHLWQDFTLRLSLRPHLWELHASASDEEARFVAEDELTRSEKRWKFSDLQNPETLLQEFGGPMAWGVLGGLGWHSALRASPANISLGVKWQARNHWMELRNSRLRVYRLNAQLPGRHEIVVFVSRVGEILRVELPNDLVLVNDALGTL